MKPITLLIASAVLGAIMALATWQRNQTLVTRGEIARVSVEISNVQARLDTKAQQIAAVRESGRSVQSEVAALARPQEEVPAWRSMPLGEAGWERDDSFVDIPKRVLKNLRVAGFLFDSETFHGPLTAPATNAHVGPEATVLLGLSDSEREVLRGTYLEMYNRFEQLQKSRLTRTDVPVAESEPQPGERVSFVIQPFPA